MQQPPAWSSGNSIDDGNFLQFGVSDPVMQLLSQLAPPQRKQVIKATLKTKPNFPDNFVRLAVCVQVLCVRASVGSNASDDCLCEF